MEVAVGRGGLQMMRVGGESVDLATDLKCGRIFQKVPGLHLEGTWQLVSEWRHTPPSKR